MNGSDQLPLPFEHAPRFDAADFLRDASNEHALTWLDRVAEWPAGRLALYGTAGCGKTHLLDVWSHSVGGIVVRGPSLRFVMPETPVAIDDADSAAGQALLHILNAAAEARFPVLLAGRVAPARWPVALPDLTSRLRALVAVEIQPPADGMLRTLLSRLLLERQISLPDSTQDWMFLRLPRTPAAMREVVARIDRLTLARGGRDHRRVARQVVAEIGNGSGTEGNEDFAEMTQAGHPAASALQ